MFPSACRQAISLRAYKFITVRRYTLFSSAVVALTLNFLDIRKSTNCRISQVMTTVMMYTKIGAGHNDTALTL